MKVSRIRTISTAVVVAAALMAPLPAKALLPQQEGLVDLAAGPANVEIFGEIGAAAATGSRVASAGDVDGNGIGDVIVGAPAPQTGLSAEYLILGRESADLTTTINLGENDPDKPQVVKVSGQESTLSIGLPIAGADLNGDGLDDLVIGSPLSADGEPKIVVLFGRQSWPGVIDVDQDLGGLGLKITGSAEAGAPIGPGFSIAGLGDIDGDGADEIAVGDPLAASGDVTDAGSIYVIYGSKEWQGSPPSSLSLDDLGGPDLRGFAVDGTFENGYVGFSLAAAGDINGDGNGDILVGAHGEGNNGAPLTSGSAYVVFSPEVIPELPVVLDGNFEIGSDGLRFDGVDANDQVGFALAGSTDATGEGSPDLLIGAPGQSNSAGAAYLTSFDSNSLPSGPVALSDVNEGLGSSLFRVGDGFSGDGLGTSLTFSGDVNGDGVADLALGAPYADRRSVDGSGMAYAIYGFGRGINPPSDGKISVGSLDSSHGYKIVGNNVQIEGDHLGMSITGTELNGDGRSDVLLGAPGGASADGKAYLIAGFGTSFEYEPIDVKVGTEVSLLPKQVIYTFAPQFSVSPALPQGLSIDPVSGAITGTSNTPVDTSVTVKLLSANDAGISSIQLPIRFYDGKTGGPDNPGDGETDHPGDGGSVKKEALSLKLLNIKLKLRQLLKSRKLKLTMELGEDARVSLKVRIASSKKLKRGCKRKPMTLAHTSFDAKKGRRIVKMTVTKAASRALKAYRRCKGLSAIVDAKAVATDGREALASKRIKLR